MKKEKKEKISPNEILEKLYINAIDLTILIPKLTLKKAREYITELRTDMEKDNCFLPETREKLALTKYAKRKFGF